MRRELWPDEDAVDTLESLREALQRGGGAVAFLAEDDSGAPIGFAEATIRRDYVNGTDTSPVGFLEGWYVVPALRGRGVGRALIAAVEDWTRAEGCTELASDALIENADSHQAHARCGFEETERVVCFRKVLTT
ncbi:MAG: GNAT family N-acetyltransferase [Lysobacter sp.]|nr:MAG: GNAT family N-acetyltransferase [Lysobacter sp.]